MSIPLRQLSIVDDGDDVIIGDPERGVFVAVPAVGGVAVRALQCGATVAEAGARASAFAGETVDMDEFVAVLHDLGFVDTGTAVDHAPVASAPVQQRGWVTGPPAALVRPLFSTAAWCGYALATLFAVGCFAVRTDLWPRATDLVITGDVGTSLLIMVPVTYVLVGLHEMWHWLAARALGLRARFGIDRRLFFLVFETDLSQLWTVPRRQRYGPQLAGLAVDMVLLAVLLAAQLAVGPARVLPALVFALVASSLWQCMVFLRTDLYGVLVTATGCRDLWRVKSLLVRRAFGRLTEEQRDELERADPHDVRVGAWFRWVWLAGYPLAGAYFAVFYVPLLVFVARYVRDGYTGGVDGARFWWGVLVAVLVYAPVVAALVIGVRAAARRR